MLCAVIMAGGRGTRFWPLSTEEKPKQFLNLLGDKTMLQMTVDRVLKIIPMERIFIVTGEIYKDLVKQQLKDIDEKNIILEPVGRNTAPCIGLAAFYINKMYKDATMLVVPSDHLVQDEDNFADIVRLGNEYVNSHDESLVTIGITPVRPETGYGYIKYNKASHEDEKIFKVDSFVEKPNIEKAMRYLASGEYLWNSGMFIWKAETILSLTEKYLKNTYDILKEISVTLPGKYEEVLNEKYGETENISIDFGIMEKAKNIFVIPASFGWDDVGSWNAMERYHKKDDSDNIIGENVEIVDGSNNIAFSNGKKIIISNVNDIFVVENQDVILVTAKDKIGHLNEVKGLLNK